MGECCHLDSDVGHFWFHSPSQGELTTIQEQNTSERILEHGGENEAHTCHTLRHCPPQTSTKTGDITPEPLSPLVGKENL